MYECSLCESSGIWGAPLLHQKLQPGLKNSKGDYNHEEQRKSLKEWQQIKVQGKRNLEGN